MVSSAAAALPPDIQQVLDDIEQSDLRGDALTSDLSDQQFHWQPDGGAGWSVGQCLEHLAVINVIYANAVESGIDNARRNGWTRSGPLAPGYFGRKFIAHQEPPVTRRFRAPTRVRPGSALTRAEILRRYHDAHVKVKQLIQHAATIDANRATFANPFLGILRVKVATGLQVIAAHDRRHLWQAEQVIRNSQFPRQAAGPSDR